MSMRSIGSKVAILALLAALHPACGDGGSTQTHPDTPDGLAILKITYFRAYPEAKTKRPEPTFRAVMSESWRDRVADGPREQLAKAAPGKIYMGYVSDAEMARYVKRLKELGIDELKSSKPEDYDPDKFGRLALNPSETSFTRIFTIGDEKGAKSYYFRDQQTSKELIEKFVSCEKFVSRACENSINVRTTTEALPGRNK